MTCPLLEVSLPDPCSVFPWLAGLVLMLVLMLYQHGVRLSEPCLSERFISLSLSSCGHSDTDGNRGHHFWKVKK